MFNIMKGMKESESGRDRGEGEVSLRPINLSTMLGSHHRRSPSADHNQHAANNKRHSESSLSPRSPRPLHRDLEDDIVADSSGGAGPPPGHHLGGGGGGSRMRHTSGGSVPGIDAQAELREKFLDDLRKIGRRDARPSRSPSRSSIARSDSMSLAPSGRRRIRRRERRSG